jgi:hypothetical protein
MRATASDERSPSDAAHYFTAGTLSARPLKGSMARRCMSCGVRKLSGSGRWSARL